MIAIATLLVVVTVTLIVNRVGTIALTATGLSVEVAHFQARSALTGVGFTTTESELIVGHPMRRRIVLTLMLLGNAGMVTIIATLVVGFAGQGDPTDALARVGTLAGGLILILLASRSRTVDRLLSKSISRLLRRFTKLELRDYVQLLDLTSNHAVAELGVEAESWVAEHQLADLHLPSEGVLVLGIRRTDGTFLGAPRGYTRIHEHDTLILYGYADVLEDLGSRRVGMEGDKAHLEHMSEIAERQAKEDAADPEP
ncbi:MAG: TrkA C-terminal domain-containing protein [Acidimicrobiia bacterium]|nr:TrkA C-terminal domain-containing protein [Acidimicrobiia bacterium]